MPTVNEYKALKDATYWKWDSTDKGYYVYAPQTGDAGNINNESSNTYNKSAALWFFPAAGFSSSTTRSSVGSYGYYWSSIMNNSSEAYRLYFSSSKVTPNDTYNRYRGFSVRPVSD